MAEYFIIKLLLADVDADSIVTCACQLLNILLHFMKRL